MENTPGSIIRQGRRGRIYLPASWSKSRTILVGSNSGIAGLQFRSKHRCTCPHSSMCCICFCKQKDLNGQMQCQKIPMKYLKDSSFQNLFWIKTDRRLLIRKSCSLVVYYSAENWICTPNKLTSAPVSYAKCSTRSYCCYICYICFVKLIMLYAFRKTAINSALK
jgi:hypothetical protein